MLLYRKFLGWINKYIYNKQPHNYYNSTTAKLLSRHTRYTQSMLVKCWASVESVVLTLRQHWISGLWDAGLLVP